MVILLLVFGSAVAMGLPIVTAVLGLLCGLSVVTLLSHLADVPTTAPTLATMIGMPRWLDRVLPHVSIEGAGYFAAEPPPGAPASAEPEPVTRA